MHKLILFVFPFLLACKANINESGGVDIALRRVPLQSYPGWPEKLCDAKVDSTRMASMSGQGFVALEFTNNTKGQLIFELNGGPICDSLFFLAPYTVKNFVENNNVDSFVSMMISSFFDSGKKISIPQDSSAVVLIDGGANLQLFSREDLHYSFHADSANVVKGYELVFRRGRNNGVLWDSINVITNLEIDFKYETGSGTLD